MSPYRQYLWIHGVVLGTCLLATLVVNSAVDPLWLLQGNRFFDQNYVFNERVAKAQLFMQDPTRYDCLIFGSSRTTLLDPTEIEGYDCFNFAFSAGNPREYLDYARYARRFGARPRLVIVGVDGYNLTDEERPSEVPDFVTRLEEPPSLLRSYATLSALRFSLTTLRHRSPYPRVYDAEFNGTVLPGAPPYEPPMLDASHPVPRDLRDHLGPFSARNAPAFAAVRAVFPEARAVGYAPPLHASWLLIMRERGSLGSFLEAVYAASREFDAFYDFTVASPSTVDVAQTYDGSHFSGAVNGRVATRLVGAESEFGVALHAVSRDDYVELHLDALAHFAARVRTRADTRARTKSI